MEKIPGNINFINKRVSVNGKPSAFQAGDASSILATRIINTGCSSAW